MARVSVGSKQPRNAPKQTGGKGPSRPQYVKHSGKGGSTGSR